MAATIDTADGVGYFDNELLEETGESPIWDEDDNVFGCVYDNGHITLYPHAP
ncbi:hypothetical protein [Duganella sp. Leaf61]|uniref:hypothetical protein n=1 Tax=Duganella sp. Leaf61 TaxID=1736227 RepID=UPI0012E19EA4|nr:hypothetical protein [Duganella sp. Leaf61]